MKKKLLLFLALLLAAALPTRAQVDLSDYTFSTGSANNEWIQLSDGVTTTTITTSSADFTPSTSSLIWYTNAGATRVFDFPDNFNFKFAGVSYTQFSMNTHGILRLGSVAASTEGYNSPLNASSSFGTGPASEDAPKIVGAGRVGTLGTDCYLKYEVHGATTGRVLVCEYKVLTYDSVLLHYQIQLWENTNEIHIVYGTRATTIPSDFFIQVGMSRSDEDKISLSANGYLYESHYGSSENISWSTLSIPNVNRYFVFTPHVRPVDNLQATDITPTSATVTWTPNSDASHWQITNSTSELSNPSSAQYIADVTNGPTSSSRFLNSNTCYHYYVRAVNADNQYSSWRHLRFNTPNTEFPYSCDFSNATENNRWETYRQSGHPNQWVIGNAVSGHTDGALYVTDNNANHYDGTASDCIYACRNFWLEANTSYAISFDWQCCGVYNQDYLQLYLVPINEQVEAGTDPSANWIALTPKLVRSNGWERFETVYNHTATQDETFRLVAMWKQIYTGVAQPPAAIDNLTVTTNLPPTNLAASVTPTSARLTWDANEAIQWQTLLANGPVDNPAQHRDVSMAYNDPSLDFSNLLPDHTYYFYVRAYRTSSSQSEWRGLEFRTSNSLPYITDFTTDGAIGWQFHNCVYDKYNWAVGTPVFPGDHADALILTSNNGATDEKSYIFATRLLSFETGTYDISFDWRGTSTSSAYARAFLVPENVQLNGYTYSITSTATPDGWIALDNGSSLTGDPWQTYSSTQEMTVGTYRLVFCWRSSGSIGERFGIDNISIRCTAKPAFAATNVTPNTATLTWATDANAVSWLGYYSTQPVSDIESIPFNSSTSFSSRGTVTSYNLTNLQPNTVYHCYLAPQVRSGEIGTWRHMQFCTAVQEFPYSCDFADPVENNRWQVVNSSEDDLNRWTVGTLIEGHEDGTLYITDGSTTAPLFHYDSTHWQFSFACRHLTLAPQSSYQGSFDYLCQGDGSSDDFLRLFLVPNSVQPNTIAYNQLMNAWYPEGWIPLTDPLRNATEWQHATFTIDHSEATQTETYQLVAAWVQNHHNNRTGTFLPAAIDNLYISGCQPVSELAVSQLTPTSARLQWSGAATEWQYLLATEEVADPASRTLRTVSQPALDATDLLASQTYHFYVRTACGDNNYSEWASLTFTTTPQLPYTCDFSDSEENSHWELVNDDGLEINANWWVIRTLAETGGTYNPAIFISSYGVGRYGYESEYESCSHAARLFSFEEGLYDISFRWRNIGKFGVNGDFLRVFLVPEDEVLEPGVYNNLNLTSTTAPEGWIPLTDALYGHSNWSDFSTTAEITTAGNYRLVFTWRNDYISSGNDSPAAVDNISVRRNTTVSSYPYRCDFSDPEENACWELINGNQTNHWVIGTEASVDGALYITDGTNGYHYNESAKSFVYAARLIHLDGGEYVFRFRWRCNGEESYGHVYDLMRAFLVPESVTLTAGEAYGMTTFNNTTPDGWYALDNDRQLYNRNYWDINGCTLTVPEGDYRLVFFWKNDAVGGNQPPAAVSEVRIVPNAEIVDATPYRETLSRKGCELSYSRNNFTPDVWIPFYVPFTATVDQWSCVYNITFAELVDVTNETVNGTVADVLHWRVMEYDDTLFAGHPYILRNDEDDEDISSFYYEFDNVRLASCTDTTVVAFENGAFGNDARRYTLTGTYDTIAGAALASLRAWCMGGGQFWQATASNALLPQRFYLTITDPVTGQPKSAPLGGTRIMVGGDEVGILEAEPEGEVQGYLADPNYYDILGRRVAQPQKGHIYIHKGKKILYK